MVLHDDIDNPVAWMNSKALTGFLRRSVEQMHGKFPWIIAKAKIMMIFDSGLSEFEFSSIFLILIKSN